jgi:hypothetical protein
MVNQSNEEPVSFSINQSIKQFASELEESPIMMTEKTDMSNPPQKKHCQVDWVHPGSIFVLLIILGCYYNFEDIWNEESVWIHNWLQENFEPHDNKLAKFVVHT